MSTLSLHPSLFDRLTSAFSAARKDPARTEYRRTVRELSALSDRDLADIGIARSDIPAIAAGTFGEL